MKQMTLIEMDGFLKGKCIPCDLKVNETNAEYLVRKFAEAEAKISALSEDQQKAIESIKQADSAVKLAHEKFSALAEENSWLKMLIEDHAGCTAVCPNCSHEEPSETDDIVWSYRSRETPATDAFLAEVRAQAFNDLCSAFVKHANLAGMDDGELVRLKYATDALLHCADQLRKGVHP
ncbi:TPA: ead/Ea22-like family protein [Escherichia coli]|uniref:ead/Ea22-like family protein n=1 Tax=Escherichia coli TaxID=562 RepID=UPI00107FF241|nr:ead/Ea22-like family protein [Escherichia coli]EFN1820661.1 ead/Ea22-like family protein [Escherichia coli]TGD22073.1 ead/Ea22-like family protein [Escherichia coli]HDW8069065.1 ead/Ea22-like family protein [Escherichia coli]HDW8102585.1 ead/Ea22-like family protein [Escherichia coli]HDW8172576.1 ead/Ea22-like family protein [Escherichia coli]